MSQKSVNRLREVLGDKFDLLKNFSMQHRNIVEQVAAQVFDTDAPLTADQAQQLHDVLMRERYRPGRNPITLGGMTFDSVVRQRVQRQVSAQHADAIAWFAPITDTMIEQARGVLSPRQLSALKNLQTQQVIQFEIAQAELGRAKPGG